MKAKKNESHPAAPESLSSRPNVTLQISAGELFLGLCQLDGPLPIEPGTDRVQQVRQRTVEHLETTYRLLNPKVEEGEIAAVKAQEEAQTLYLATEKTLRRFGIPEERSIFAYHRQRGIKRYKKNLLHRLIKDMRKARLDPFEYTRKRPPLEGFVITKAPGHPALEGNAKFPRPPKGFVKVKGATSLHTEPHRIGMLIVEQFINWLTKKKKAKARARTARSRNRGKKSTEILT
jgi:hypothetical protein